MGQRKKQWQAMGPSAEQRIPGSTVRGAKDNNIQTLPMSDRKRDLVKTWIASASDKGRRY